jgi:hypothetical protein
MRKNSTLKGIADDVTMPSQPAIPNIYFNSFALNMTSADFNAVLLTDGQPVCRLNMSFTTAKTLNHFLNEAIVKLEQITDRKIMTTDYVEKALKKLQTAGQP